METRLVISKNYITILKNIDEPIAFVLGSYITGLGIIRSLGRKGIPVVGLDSNPRQMGFFSKYCIGVKCPHPRYNERSYVDFLINIGKKLNDKGVLIPTSDMHALVLLKNQQELEKYFRIPMAELDASSKLINKQRLYETFEKLEIPYPKTYFPNDVSDLIDISKKIDYPCIVKPANSYYFKLDFRAKFFIVNSEQELIQKFKEAKLKKHEVVVQEIIPGDAKNMYGFNAYYDKNFISKGTFMYRRIREWPHMYGNGCLIERTTTIPELEKIVTFIIKEIKYYGIIDAEFKKDYRDNTFKLIEINARPWMQNNLSSGCGFDLAYIAYMDAIGKNIEKSKTKKNYVKWLLASDDFSSSIIHLLKSEISLREWINSFKGKKMYAFFAWDDPIPFFVAYAKSVFYLVPYILQHSSNRCGIFNVFEDGNDVNKKS